MLTEHGLCAQEIVTTNRVLRECMETGQPPYKLVEAWDQVQLQTATLLNADQPGLQAGGHAPGKPMRCAACQFCMHALPYHCMQVGLLWCKAAVQPASQQRKMAPPARLPSRLPSSWGQSMKTIR